MAVNRNSGRLVVDVAPDLKLALHAALAADGLSLKEWFTQRATQYLAERRQPALAFVADPHGPSYSGGAR